MTIHRVLHPFPKRLIAGLTLVGLLGLGGWLLVKSRLAELGVEHLEVSGLELGWNRVAFDSVRLTWTGEGRSVLLEALEPALTMDWRSWQLDALVARSATAVQALPAVAASAQAPEAVRLTLPESVPFWFPRHLAVNSLDAFFPCDGSQCHLKGSLRLDRDTDSATARVDATLSRDQRSLTVAGDVRLGSGADDAPATEGELTVTGLQLWLPRTGEGEWRRLLPRAATLRFAPAEGQGEPGQWPMTVALTTEGGASAAFEGQVVLHTEAPWRLDIRRGRLTGRLNQWRQAGWLADKLRADLPVTGRVSAEGASLEFLRGARLEVRHLDPLQARDLMWLDGLALSVRGLALSYQDGQLHLTGPVELVADEVRHPALMTQGWRLSGDFQGAGQPDLTGTLANAAGMTLPFRLRYHPTEGLEASGSMALTAGNQANHLGGTLAAWPPTLSLDEGHVGLTGQLNWKPGTAPEASAALELADASGVYERVAWQGLSGQVEAQAGDGQVSLTTGNLVLDQLNPGLPLGPVRVTAGYQSDLEAPMAGLLELASAEAGFAGGKLGVTDQLWRLDDAPWRVPVTIHDLELSALMDLYPTEGLAGEGTLRGELPVLIGRQGIRVEDGALFALPPGGWLQLPAEQLQGIASTNETMALVARAMEDFRYHHLESDIQYSEQGILVLDLQLRGNSPKVDSERPVVLNINLEEDIPALLTSLQLSGRVNEAVTERVRRLMQREGATP